MKISVYFPSLRLVILFFTLLSPPAYSEEWQVIRFGSAAAYADKDSVVRRGNLAIINFKLSMCEGVFTAKMNCAKAEIFDTDVGSYFHCTKGGLPEQVFSDMYELACPRWYKFWK